MADIFEKFASLNAMYAKLIDEVGMNPFSVRIQNFVSPTEADVNGRRCILMGSNNYLGPDLR